MSAGGIVPAFNHDRHTENEAFIQFNDMRSFFRHFFLQLVIVFGTDLCQLLGRIGIKVSFKLTVVDRTRGKDTGNGKDRESAKPPTVSLGIG